MIAALASMAVLAAGCSSEGEGGGLNEGPLPTPRTQQPTAISPEQLAQQSAESSGFALKVMAVEDPAQAAGGFTVDATSRLMAVQVELANVDSTDTLPVDVSNATVTDENGITYSAVADARDGQITAEADLKQGEKASGWMAFQVPKDAKLTSITYRVGLISVVAMTADLPQK
jgi:hypothetical protein